MKFPEICPSGRHFPAFIPPHQKAGYRQAGTDKSHEKHEDFSGQATGTAGMQVVVQKRKLVGKRRFRKPIVGHPEGLQGIAIKKVFVAVVEVAIVFINHDFQRPVGYLIPRWG